MSSEIESARLQWLQSEPLSQLKKHERNLKRFVSREGLPEDIKANKAEELAALQSELARRAAGGSRAPAPPPSVLAVIGKGPAAEKKLNAGSVAAEEANAASEKQQKKKKKEKSVDYKKIRFIEKTKIQKQLAALDKRLGQLRATLQHHPDSESGQLSLAQCEQQRRALLEALLYVQHFPLKEHKYLSLYPPSPYPPDSPPAVLQAKIRGDILAQHSVDALLAKGYAPSLSSRRLEEKKQDRAQRRQLQQQIKRQAEQNEQGDEEGEGDTDDDEDDGSSSEGETPRAPPAVVVAPPKKQVEAKKKKAGVASPSPSPSPSSAKIRWDEESSSDEEEQQQKKKKQKKKAKKQQRQQSASPSSFADAFFVPAHVQLEQTQAPQEYLADLSRAPSMDGLEEGGLSDQDAPAPSTYSSSSSSSRKRGRPGAGGPQEGGRPPKRAKPNH